MVTFHKRQGNAIGEYDPADSLNLLHTRELPARAKMVCICASQQESQQLLATCCE